MKTYSFDNFDEGRAISRAKSPGKEKHINCLLNPFNLETIIMVSVVLDFASPTKQKTIVTNNFRL